MNVGMRVSGIVLGALVFLLVAGCAPEKLRAPGVPLVPVPAGERRELVRDLDPKGQGMRSWAKMREAVTHSLQYARSREPGELAAETGDGPVTWARIVETLELLREVLPLLDDRPELVSELFDWYRLDPEPLLTGYYEPVLEASLRRTQAFSFPLYGPPDDLQVADLGRFHPRWKGERLVYRVEKGRIVPYHSRQEIDQDDALAGRGREIAWIRDPLDAFFLQIQGSGRLRFRDGTERHVLYAGKNGLPYVSLGRVLIKKGYLPEGGVSMGAIRAFMAEHPELRDELLATNPSYVFFRLGEDGPYGAMGRPLTPMTSLATDPKLLPLGTVLLTEAVLPMEASPDGERRVIFGLAQDVGGAVKNHHLDLFCGAGERAGYTAGRLQARARVYLLLARRDDAPGDAG